MTFVRVAHFPGATKEQYLAIDQALGDAVDDAPGRLMFAAGPTPDGWEIVQVWQTEEQMADWVQRHLGAAFAKVGDRGYPAPPIMTDFEVDDLRLT
jgi:hypothetical protein